MNDWADMRWRIDVLEGPATTGLTLASVRDEHLRVATGSVENAYIQQLMLVAYAEAERVTRRSLATQTLALVMDRFPSWEFEIPRPPLQSVESITYIDTDGNPQVLTGSPAQFLVSAPTGPRAVRGRVSPLYGTVWPTTRMQLDAVTVTYTAGYPDVGSPPLPDIPAEIQQGMLLVIGELYKQRSESVEAHFTTRAILSAEALFGGYRVY